MRDIKIARDGAHSPSSLRGLVVETIDDFLKLSKQDLSQSEQHLMTAFALKELAAAAVALALLEEFDGDKGPDDHMALLQDTFTSVQYRAVDLFGEFSSFAL